MRKTFYVLSDDKVMAGARRPPAKAPAEAEPVQPMETDAPDKSQPETVSLLSVGTQSLAAKLSANLASKRKATEPPDHSGASDKSKSRR